MDAPLGRPKPRTARAVFLLTAFAPVLPQLVGSAFNIFYNREIIIPLLATKELKLRFVQTLVAYNAIVYPIAVYLWVRLIVSLRPPFDALSSGRQVPAQELDRVQRRVVHLPWWGALLSGLGWLGCIPVFLLSLATVGHALDPVLLWHFPISILISTLISTTHGIFFVEAISYRHLFPVFFRDSRALLASGQMALSLRWRGVLWAVSIGICPIASLLLLSFAPTPEGTHPQIFATVVAVAGAALGLFSAWLASSLVATPIDELQTAARHVAAEIR
jgi:adenylate cyclase